MTDERPKQLLRCPGCGATESIAGVGNGDLVHTRKLTGDLPRALEAIPLLRLDLGSGETPLEGFVGADRIGHADWRTAGTGDVAKVDLAVYPWPWSTSSVELVWSAYLVDYLPPAGWSGFCDELHRVLVPGGQAKIRWYNMRTSRGWQDPRVLDHIPIERWNFASSDWRARHTKAGPEQQGLPYGNLETVEFAWEGIHDAYAARSEESKAFGAAHDWDFAADCTVILRAAK